MAKKLHFATLIISLFLLLPVSSIAQEYTLIKTIKAKEAKMLTDAFGNLYIIEDFRLTMYTINGEKVGVFEDYKSGKISYVDVINPMKILVYFQDFMIAKVLDKKLSEIASLSLNDLNYYAVDVIANANDGDFWLFDKTDFKFKKITNRGEMVYESERFNVLLNEDYNPKQILDYERHLYLNDPEVGVLLFDRFGVYQKTIPLKGAETIQVIWGRILYFKDNELHSYNEKSFENRSMKLPEGENYKFAQLQKDRVFVQTDSKIMIYSYLD